MSMRVWLVILPIAAGAAPLADAADLNRVATGKVLFEQQWKPGPTPTGGDGLGPVFNEASCAACHHQGGIGGSAGNKHSVLVVGIEAMRAERIHPDDPSPADIVATLHPDLKDGGAMITTRSTNPRFNAYLQRLTTGMKGTLIPESETTEQQAEAGKRKQGGKYANSEKQDRTVADGAADDPATVARLPLINARYSAPLRSGAMEIDLRISRRSTPPLFGHGLIDKISPERIVNVAKQQQKHPEISGRPSQTPAGQIGKFGFRATSSTLYGFVDQACAMELGLQTQDTKQAKDPTQPHYAVSGYDISRDQVQMLTEYIAALPAPSRAIPSDSRLRMQVEKGERLFASVGCSTCHVPDMGPAKGLYSDMLLHDMGDRLSDYAPAYPYVKKTVPINDRISNVVEDSQTESTTIENVTTMRPHYYGGYTPPGEYVRTANTTARTSRLSGGSLKRALGRSYSYTNSPYPPRTRYVELGGDNETIYHGESTTETNSSSSSKYDTITTNEIKKARTMEFVSNNYIMKQTIEPTNVRNEWRTTPLWGLRDTPPYMHDGRAETVLEAIAMHAGEAAGTRDRFLALSIEDQNAVLAFLNTMVAPPANPLTTLATAQY